ncbi:MAG: hypothetical protein CMD25_00465 [Flavobacteriales bacterium]|nr:hypothetical protein [Flavobacteriales bacterium]|tara:strand:+ start:8844 stop:11012 length:2169 start_codon:yes stop_codon:yes gene_type:complete
MTKKYPKSDAIPDQSLEGEEAYVTWGDDLSSKQEALSKSSESMSEYTAIEHTTGSRRRGLDYSNLDTNTSGRPGLTKLDYDFFRPDEAVPKRVKMILKKAEDIYQRVGLVKNVIDLMGDFGSQGIRIVHPNKRIERFYKRWFEKCGGKERSERFLSNLYKSGNVVVNRQTGKLTLKTAEKMYKTSATADLLIDTLDETSVDKREIPWKYTFIDPVYVEVSAGSLASFVTDKRYELILPASLRKTINSPKSEAEKQVVAQLPDEILEAAKSRKNYPLNPQKVRVFHYKKDDWQRWAFPMIYSIMDDITVIEKLKLADMAALDGAISNIRIFKLGSLEHKIAPTKAAAAKLAGILGNNVGGGTMDLVWGPDIELLESRTSVHQFLGEGKYTPHLNSVYAGLGIPPTLTGTFGAAGTTNNFISLKTLTQRLQYGRDVLIKFWNDEIKLVQKAMGFRKPAMIEFDRMDLSNEEAEKSLLIQLADRNLISDELLQKRFGFDPEMEKIRLNREKRERKSDRMIPKSSPYHDPQPENSLKKIALQSGVASPSEVGLELDPKKDGEKSSLEMRQAFKPTKLAKDSKESLPGQPQQGRPRNSKDKEQRKERTFTPQTGASLHLWASAAQDEISEIINPILLDFFGKKNLRSLANDQSKELENIKSSILFNSTPFCTINKEYVQEKLNNLDTQHLTTYSVWLRQLASELNKDLTVDDQKQAKASFYCLLKNN